MAGDHFEREVLHESRLHMKNPLLEYRSFQFLWSFRIVETLALQMMMVAIGWQMYDITHSAYDLGLVGLFQFLPSLALTLVVGQVADRFDRRRILQLCLVAQACITVWLLVGTHGTWLSRNGILAASLAIGVCRAFQMPCMSALLPSVVPPTALPQALAIHSAGGQMAIIVGPALGGFLYVGGPNAVYLTCGILSLAAVFLMLGVVVPQRCALRREPVSLQTLFAGVSFIWSRKVVLGAISLDLFAVLLGGATALLPIYAKDILHTGPWGQGLLRSAPAVGALLMSVYLSHTPIRHHAGKMMFGGVALFGVVTIIFGLSTSFALSLPALVLLGMGDTISVVVRQSLVQLDTPDAMRGRVSAVNSIFIGASNQLGEFESGLTAYWFGPVASVVIGGLGTLAVVVIWMKLFPALTRRDQLVGEPEDVPAPSQAEQQTAK